MSKREIMMASAFQCVRALSHQNIKITPKRIYSQRPKTQIRVQARNQKLIVKASAEELDQLPDPADARGSIALGKATSD